LGIWSIGRRGAGSTDAEVREGASLGLHGRDTGSISQRTIFICIESQLLAGARVSTKLDTRVRLRLGVSLEEWSFRLIAPS
jgi:hypothetical protein